MRSLTRLTTLVLVVSMIGSTAYSPSAASAVRMSGDAPSRPTRAVDSPRRPELPLGAEAARERAGSDVGIGSGHLHPALVAAAGLPLRTAGSGIRLGRRAGPRPSVVRSPSSLRGPPPSF